MFAHRERVRVGGDIGNVGVGGRGIVGKGEDGFDFRVARKILRALGQDRRTRGVQRVFALLGLDQALSDSVGIQQEEVRGIHQHVATLGLGLFRFHLEPEEH